MLATLNLGWRTVNHIMRGMLREEENTRQTLDKYTINIYDNTAIVLCLLSMSKTEKSLNIFVLKYLMMICTQINIWHAITVPLKYTL